MNSKNQEEVMKRRAKLRSSRVNVYQKMVLGVGILSLILAVGVSPAVDPLLPAGVGGGTLLLFFLLKSPKPKREGPESIESADPPLPVDKTDPEEEEILLREEDIVSLDSPAIVLEKKEAEEAQESLLDSGKKAVHDEAIRVQEPVLLGKEALKNQQEFSGNGTLLHIQERLVMLEEKTINLGEMLLQLEKKVGDLQKNPLKEEPKIDLQTILSDTGENPEKMAQ